MDTTSATMLLTGYARCSTDEQDLTAQCQALMGMGVPAERIYTDKGLTGTNRNRPGLDQALASVRAGDTLVVPKLDRLARSVPDARTIGDSLVARSVKLRVGPILYDPADPMGKMFFNILATFAEFDVTATTTTKMTAADPGTSLPQPRRHRHRHKVYADASIHLFLGRVHNGRTAARAMCLLPP